MRKRMRNMILRWLGIPPDIDSRLRKLESEQREAEKTITKLTGGNMTRVQTTRKVPINDS